MEKILQEILAKLNVVMSYTYINETTNLMDVYNELVKEQQAKGKGPAVKLTVAELKSYAAQTGKFKVDGARKIVLIEKDGMTFEVPLEEFNKDAE